MMPKQEKRKKRHRKIRSRISGDSKRPRLCVFRSAKHIQAQLIDDDKGVVLASASDSEISSRKKAKEGLSGKTLKAYHVGELIAQKAKVKEALFDRGGYKYQGRVKALAQGARDGGLKF